MTVTAIQNRRMAESGGQASGLTVEAGLYIAIGALAFALRIADLGGAPFSAGEAREALAAWRFVSMSSLPPAQPVSPALFTLTSLVFALFGASEFWARFWPMAAGTALVYAPLLFRRELGRPAALAACALLAISPVMMAASRTVDGAALAALCVVVFVGGVRSFAERGEGRGILAAGIAIGIGLADGPRFVSAAAAFLLMLILVALTKPRAALDVRKRLSALRSQAPRLLTAAAITFLLSASAALLNPSGLSAAGAGLPRWLGGWLPSSGTRPAWLVLQVVAAYEPLAAVMGVGGLYVAFLSGLWKSIASRVGYVFAAREPEMEPAPAEGGGAADVPWRDTASVLGAATLGAVLFSVIYLGREASDALWVVLPLAMLAGKTLAETFSGAWFEEEWSTVAAQAGVLFVMIVFVYFNLGAYAHGYPLLTVCPDFLQGFLPVDCTMNARLLLAGIIGGLGVFVVVMFALGWNRVSAVRGMALALTASTIVGTLGAGAGLTRWRTGAAGELWTPRPTTANAHLMMSSIEGVSERATGERKEVEIVVVVDPESGEPDGLLGWELRDFPNARYVDTIAAAANSPIVITDGDVADPALGSAYVGAHFPLQVRPLNTDGTARDLIGWWFFRDWPGEFSRTVRVWVRSDLHDLTVNEGQE